MCPAIGRFAVVVNFVALVDHQQPGRRPVRSSLIHADRLKHSARFGCADSTAAAELGRGRSNRHVQLAAPIPIEAPGDCRESFLQPVCPGWCPPSVHGNQSTINRPAPCPLLGHQPPQRERISSTPAIGLVVDETHAAAGPMGVDAWRAGAIPLLHAGRCASRPLSYAHLHRKQAVGEAGLCSISRLTRRRQLVEAGPRSCDY